MSSRMLREDEVSPCLLLVPVLVTSVWCCGGDVALTGVVPRSASVLGWADVNFVALFWLNVLLGPKVHRSLLRLLGGALPLSGCAVLCWCLDLL